MSLDYVPGVRPWARSIKERITIGPHAGVMPPWFVEKDIGIQRIKADPSLSDQGSRPVVKWVNNVRRSAIRPTCRPALKFRRFGQMDHRRTGLDRQVRRGHGACQRTRPVGKFWTYPTGLTKDRYVQALEVREVNDVPKDVPTKTVGDVSCFTT